MISYEPLWRTLQKKKKTTYYLTKQGISRGTMHNLRHGIGISTKTIDHLCSILDCSVSDIIAYKKEPADRRVVCKNEGLS